MADWVWVTATTILSRSLQSCSEWYQIAVAGRGEVVTQAPHTEKLKYKILFSLEWFLHTLVTSAVISNLWPGEASAGLVVTPVLADGEVQDINKPRITRTCRACVSGHLFGISLGHEEILSTSLPQPGLPFKTTLFQLGNWALLRTRRMEFNKTEPSHRACEAWIQLTESTYHSVWHIDTQWQRRLWLLCSVTRLRSYWKPESLPEHTLV